MMALICSVLFLIASSLDIISGTLYRAQFEGFIQEFNKNYANEEGGNKLDKGMPVNNLYLNVAKTVDTGGSCINYEFNYRLSVFSKNMEEASRLQKEELGTAQYGVTKFSDLTGEEFQRYYLNSVNDLPTDDIEEYKVDSPPKQKSCDWRKAGAISPVKNQGQCGSCWAFGAVANIEALWGIRGYPMSLSEQQILDCGPQDSGCNGGSSKLAFDLVLREGGIASSRDYPYMAAKQQCRSCWYKKAAWIGGFGKLPRNEEDMAAFLACGTITVSLNATLLHHYQNQVVHPCFKNCDSRTNHAVLIVGYAEDKKNGPYWIVKNSWGKNWGEKGYFRIARGKNVCGIATSPISAYVDYPGKKKIKCPE